MIGAFQLTAFQRGAFQIQQAVEVSMSWAARSRMVIPAGLDSPVTVTLAARSMMTVWARVQWEPASSLDEVWTPVPGVDDIWTPVPGTAGSWVQTPAVSDVWTPVPANSGAWSPEE